jgi:DNA (cytosine-5)-methyltransferase 1
MKYLSLFTGIGGFELGIQQAHEENKEQAYEYHRKMRKKRRVRSDKDKSHNIGDLLQGDTTQSRRASCIGYSEIDKYAIQIFEKHYPKIKNYGDITTINVSKLPDFDLICGGFPCQSFSIAGKRGGFNDTRGTLFFDIARIIKAKRPRLLFLENVKGLLSHDGGRTFDTIIRTLDELGYDIQWQVLNSKNFGVPQNRERVFIIGHLRGTPRPKVFPIGQGGKESNEVQPTAERQQSRIRSRTKKSESDNVSFEGGGTRKGRLSATMIHNVYGGFGEGIREFTSYSPTIRTPKGGGHLPMVVHKNHEKNRTDSFRYKQYSRGLGQRKVDGQRSNDIHRESMPGIFEGTKIRRLTPTECERLQGFPDGWTEGLSDTQRYKTLGNAVTVNVIREIMKRLCK